MLVERECPHRPPDRLTSTSLFRGLGIPHRFQIGAHRALDLNTT
ncbi:hypothetical protein U91I_02758 [alpha proteobacterium U9-1i]|nr:hypothetical protein U91I_02758 [alpha proteobacterium U9-1i]